MSNLKGFLRNQIFSYPLGIFRRKFEHNVVIFHSKLFSKVIQNSIIFIFFLIGVEKYRKYGEKD